MIEIVKTVISLLPVCLFLTALVVLDSYKLVSTRSVLAAILSGGIAALVCLFVNQWMLDHLSLSRTEYTRYFSPLLEEIMKSLFLVYLFKRRKIGFMVDAAIYGFAIGTGFALVENIYYLIGLKSTNLLLWIVRGLGTAAIHGATMAILGIITKTFADRRGNESLLVFLPGFMLAVVIHSFYNHFIFSPIMSTLIIVLVLPLVLIAVFNRSEQMTRDWLGIGFDSDQELLKVILSGKFSETRVGKYLKVLQGKFPPQVVADMFCLLRIHTELALKAKGILMLREAGIPSQFDQETKAKLDEKKYLERSIGQTGMLAIAPFLYTSSRDLWQLQNIHASGK